MSITSDIRDEIRGYADLAYEQGRAAVEQGISTVETIVATAVGMAADAAAGVRDDVRHKTDQAGQAAADVAQSVLPVDAVRDTVDPYLTQAKQYRDALAERAAGLVDALATTARNDERVGRAIDAAETVGNVVVATIAERVVEPLSALARSQRGPSSKPSSKPASKPSSKPASKPAAKPAAKKTAAAKKTPRAAATKATTAKKSVATKTATKRPAAKKTAAKKPAAKKSAD